MRMKLLNLKNQLANRISILEKATVCYDEYELAVQVATVVTVSCIAVAALTGPIAPLSCGVLYVGMVGEARVQYENCIKGRTGG